MIEQVLVTGGAGFLGQHLVRVLRARGVQVRVLIRPGSRTANTTTQALQSMGAELAWGNILDPAVLQPALRDVTGVFHLAGRLFVPGIAACEYEQLHIQGTRNLLAACAEAGSVRAIVHCSTTGVVGPTGPAPADEDTPLRPSNIYEATKAAGEQLALDMADRHKLSLVVARPALIYGPGDVHLLSWFRAIDRGYYRVVGRGDNLLHPIYVGDVVDGLLRCAQIPKASGQVYHLVGAQALPIRELAQAIARALSRSLPPGQIPVSAALGLAALFEMIPGPSPASLPLTRSRVRFMTERRAYSGARARDELGFVPQVDLETGLQRTVAWYRSEGLL
jgi:nucleoside-diphosphate-sugar epimerase